MIERVRVAFGAMRESAVLACSYAERNQTWWDDQMTTDAIAKRVEEVAEAAKYRFPVALRDEYPTIEWTAIAGMRDRLVHDYDRLDVEIIRNVVQEHLPRLIGAIDRILEA